MKVLHFIWSLNVGGAETLLIDILREQMKHDDIALMIGNAEASQSLLSTIPDGIRLVLLNRPAGSRNPYYFLKIQWELYKFRPDIIHTHHDSLIRLLSFVNKTKVVTIHSTGLPLTERLTEYCQVFCISEAVGQDVTIQIPTCKPVVVHNGIRISCFKTKKQNPVDSFRIVQVSRLDHNVKGQDILLRSLHVLKEQSGLPEIFVDFIGAGMSRAFLEQLTSDLGLAGRCRFLGEQSREYLYDNLCNYDLLVQPSRSEGFGLTIVEGMAAKIPVLVSSIDGPLEIIGHGKFGYQFSSEDHLDCARLILQIIRDYQDGNISELIDRAHFNASNYYDIERTAMTYRAEYGKLIQQHREVGK